MADHEPILIDDAVDSNIVVEHGSSVVIRNAKACQIRLVAAHPVFISANTAAASLYGNQTLNG